MLSFQQGHSIVHAILFQLEAAVWEVVAVKNLANMVPTNVTLMNEYTFQSLAQQKSKYLQLSDSLELKEAHPINPKQTLIEGSIPSTLKPLIQPMPGSTKLKPKTLSRNFKKVSSLSSVLDASPTKSTAEFNMNSSGIMNKNLAQLQKIKVKVNNPVSSQCVPINNLQNISNQSEKAAKTSSNVDSLRDKMLLLQEMRRAEVNKSSLARQEREEREAKLRKKLKEIQKISFDYTGQFFSSKNSNPVNTLSGAAMPRTFITADNPQRQHKKVLSNLRVKTQATEIANERISERKQRYKAQRALTESMQANFKESSAAKLAKCLKEDDQLSQGVRIQETTSNFSCQKQLNRTGGRITLSEFKREMASRRFQQFRLKTNKIKKEKTVHVSTEKDIEQRDLDPEVSRRKFKTVVSSQKSLLNDSRCALTTQKAQRLGSISVSNPSLLQSILPSYPS